MDVAEFETFTKFTVLNKALLVLISIIVIYNRLAKSSITKVVQNTSEIQPA